MSGPATTMANTGMSRDIPLALIDPDPEQPRTHFEPAALEELARSMAETGLAVSVLVRPVGDRFVLVHGERRWRAAGALGWEAILATVRDLDPDTAHWLALVENVQRSDLTPLEEALAFKGRLDRGITQTELGRRIGKSQSYVAQKMRLLNLPSPVFGYLSRRDLSEGHARELLRFRGFYGEDGPRFGYRVDDVAEAADRWPDDVVLATVWLTTRPLDCPPGWVWPGTKAQNARQTSVLIANGETRRASWFLGAATSSVG